MGYIFVPIGCQLSVKCLMISYGFCFLCLECAILFIISSRDIHQGFRTFFSYLEFFQRFGQDLIYSVLSLFFFPGICSWFFGWDLISNFLSFFFRDLFLLSCGWVLILCSRSSSLSS